MHLGQLTSMLRAPGVTALPGSVAIVAVKAAGSIAQQRPFFISKVLPVLLGLGRAKVYPLSDDFEKQQTTGMPMDSYTHQH